jgi:hypothetical protein
MKNQRPVEMKNQRPVLDDLKNVAVVFSSDHSGPIHNPLYQPTNAQKPKARSFSKR